MRARAHTHIHVTRRDALLIIATSLPVPVGIARALAPEKRASYIILDLRLPARPKWVALTIPPLVTVDSSRPSINKGGKSPDRFC